jgi:hypothetical protein
LPVEASGLVGDEVEHAARSTTAAAMTVGHAVRMRRDRGIRVSIDDLSCLRMR